MEDIDDLEHIVGSSPLPSELGTTITGCLGNVPFKFGIDPDTGDYGYIKAGADSVTPFSSSDSIIYIGGSQSSTSGFNHISTSQTPSYKIYANDTLISTISYFASGSIYIDVPVSVGINNLSFRIREYDGIMGWVEWQFYSKSFNSDWDHAIIVANVTCNLTSAPQLSTNNVLIIPYKNKHNI